MNDTHCTRRVAIKLAVTCMLAATTASVGWAELTTLVNKGDPSNRVDIVFLGDGYTQDDLDAGIYDAHIQSFLDTLFNSVGGLTEPMIRAGVHSISESSKGDASTTAISTDPRPIVK